MFLKMVTMDSEQDLEHLSTSDYHNSEHSSVLLVFWKNNCDQICQKRSYTCTVSRLTFHRHLIATPTDQHNMCLILLKVEQSAFNQAPFSSLFDVHECLGGLQLAPSSHDKQTTNCDSLHNWLMNLVVGLAALCDMWKWKWHQWKLFPCF